MVKVGVYSLGAIVAFVCFFYFYSADIFEAAIIESTGSAYSLDIALKGFFDLSELPKAVSKDLVTSVSPTLKGWFLLVICLVGIPIMIGYRLATTKPREEE